MSQSHVRNHWLTWVAIVIAALALSFSLFPGLRDPILPPQPPPPVEVVELGGTHFSGPLYTSDLILTGHLQYGDNDLYPLGHASDGRQLVTGTDDITGTLEIDHGLTTVTWALCTLGQDTHTDAAICTTSVATNTVTVKTWKADGTTAGSHTDVTVHWLVVGQP